MLTLESEYRETCPGCGTFINEYHSEFCDTARCGITGDQKFSCDTFNEDNHECENTKWSGYWPGVKECFEYGLFSYFVPNLGFVPCDPEHPNAVCDLNTLLVRYAWDSNLQKRVPKNG